MCYGAHANIIIKTELLHLHFLALVTILQFETLLFGQKQYCFTFLHNTFLTIYLLICCEHGDSAADLQVHLGNIFIQIRAFKFFIWPPHMQTSQIGFHQCKIYRIGVLALTNIRSVRKYFGNNILNIKEIKGVREQQELQLQTSLAADCWPQEPDNAETSLSQTWHRNHLRVAPLLLIYWPQIWITYKRKKTCCHGFSLHLLSWHYKN